jgi:hypothetical protein
MNMGSKGVNTNILNWKGLLVVVLVSGIAGGGALLISSPAQAADSKEVVARKKLMKTEIGAGMGQISWNGSD